LGINNGSLYEQFSGHNGEQNQKGQKVLIISLSNTGANPRTVMIELLYAGVTVLAVYCSWRAVDVAGVAEFKLKVVAFDDCAVAFLEIAQEFGVVVVVGGDLAVL
jgi:hypothetical protein